MREEPNVAFLFLKGGGKEHPIRIRWLIKAAELVQNKINPGKLDFSDSQVFFSCLTHMEPK